MAELPLAALLGRGARYSGEMAFEGRVRVDGHFTGRIVTEDVLEVGESGTVEGEIDAATLVIAGSVKATVHARERIVVQSTGQLAGKADCNTLEVAPGARIHAELRVGGG